MVYYNLLFREKAKLQTDEPRWQEYIAKADQWQAKAKELRKKMQAQEEERRSRPKRPKPPTE